MAGPSSIARSALRTVAHDARSTSVSNLAARSLATSSRVLAQADHTSTTNAIASSSSSLATDGRKAQVQSGAPVDLNALNDPQSPKSATSLSPSPPPPKGHSKLTVAVVKVLARLLGYNSTSSTAIRVTSELYDACAAQAELQADFFYGKCQLPPTYQTWFQITTMHVHLLLTRFRALDNASKAHAYSQELINHFFIDAESRMRMRFGVQTSRLVKGYMQEMHTQQRGAVLGLDEALSYSVARDTARERYDEADAALATALWRNLWGAGGWGKGVGGVKRKLKGIDRESDQEKKAREAAVKEGREVPSADEGKPELAPDLGAATAGRGEYNVAAAAAAAQKSGASGIAALEHNDNTPGNDLDFAIALERMVTYYRRETARLASISNAEIEQGRVGQIQGKTMDERMESRKNLVRVGDFGRA